MSNMHHNFRQQQQQQQQNQEDDDEEMMNQFDTAPSRPVLVRYEVANNVFEVPDRYTLQYAIGQGAYGIVW
jgi:hypothetical protein